MKKHTIISLASIAMLSLTGFATEFMPTQADSSACNALGLDLYRSLDQAGKNICISPYSIQSALLMTHHGADKGTLLEMQKVLHIDSAPESFVRFHSIYIKDLKKRLNRKIPRYYKIDKTKISLANRIFLEQSYKPKQSFLDLCKNQYDAPVESLDFISSPNKSRLRINQWVSQQTNDKIQNLLGEGSIDANTKMVLTNCLYFKASWSKAFKKENTKLMPFYANTQEKSRVDTMHLTHRFGYKQTLFYQAISIPFGAFENFQMLVILPNKGIDLTKVTNVLSQSELLKLAQLPSKKLALALPKFKLESQSMSLKDTLASLGMKSAFTNHANFTKITDTNDLKIDDIVHKTYIAIDEGGAEAAAATAVVMRAKGGGPIEKPEKPLTVKVNRPFFFAIQDRHSGHCYFIGSIKKL